MKRKIELKNKINLIAIYVTLFTVTGGINSFAQNLNTDAFDYRDYLDFGQNKGQFSDINKENIKNVSKNGKEVVIERVPDFSAKSNNGVFTSVGRGVVATATHYKVNEDAYYKSISFDKAQKNWTTSNSFGNTSYQLQTGYHGTENSREEYGADTTYMRTDKYIIEGQMSGLDIEGLESAKTHHTTIDGKIVATDIVKNNVKLISEYLKKIDKENKGQLQIYQAGTGYLQVSGTNEKFSNITIGGGIHSLNSEGATVDFKTNKQYEADSISPGIMMGIISDKEFGNYLTKGDSGSSILLWDSIKEKWVVLGVTSVGAASSPTSSHSPVLQVDINDYMKNFEVRNVKKVSELEKDKDNFLTGNIELTSNKNMGIGGLVIEKNNNITVSTNNDSKFEKLAGVDVEEGATLNFGTKLGTELHKIGKGTLNVIKATDNNLRVGEGIVDLQVNDAFNKIYITSGRAEVKVGDNVDNFKLDEVYFGTRGGKLDINGKSLTAQTINSNDRFANIINKNINKSTLTLNGIKEKDTIIHSTIGGKEHNNIDLILDNSQNINKNLVLNGDINISGKIDMTTGSNVTIQGKPVVHAYLAEGGAKPEDLAPYIEKVPTRPSELTQNDWLYTEITTKDGINLNNSNLNIGKYSIIKSDLTASNKSIINLGGDIEYFIDKNDGENIKNGKLENQQLVESGKLTSNQENDKILFTGNIKLIDSTFNSNINNLIAGIELESGSKLNANNLFVTEGQKVVLKDTSKAVIDNLVFDNIENSSEILNDSTSNLTINKNLEFNKVKDFKIANTINSNNANLLSKESNITVSNGDIGFKNISLNNSNYTQENGKLLLNNSNIEMSNNSVLKIEELDVKDISNDNFSIDNTSKIFVTSLNADNTHLNLNNFEGDLKKIDAKNNSKLYLETFDTSNGNLKNITTDTTSQLYFDHLSFKMGNEHKYDGLNVGLVKKLEFTDVNKNKLEKDDFAIKLGNLDLNPKGNDYFNIDIKFDSSVTNPGDIADPIISKDNIDMKANTKDTYTFIKADKVTGKNIYVNDMDINGEKLFAEVELTENDVKIKFTNKNSNSLENMEDLVGNSISNKLSQVVFDYVNKNGNENSFVTDMKIALQQKDKIRTQALLHEANTDIENIALQNNIEPLIHIITENQKQINNRIMSRNLSFTSKSILENKKFHDIQTEKMFMTDSEEDKIWYSVGGKLYKENNNNKHEFTTTNVGYDNLKIMNNGTKLYGVFFGYNNGSYKEKNEKIKSTAKGYSVGGYLDYAYNSGHELQSDLVLTYLQSEADYHILRNMEESKNDGFGIALTNKYKYEIKLKTESNSQHILKPILLTELSYNTVDGYESKTYKQKKFDVLSGALGTGLEYTIINSNQAHTLQGIVKGNIFESKDKINATLSGSDVYMSYSKEKYPIIAELNYIGKTQMNENLALEYSIGGEFRDDGAKGINGSLKLEYKF